VTPPQGSGTVKMSIPSPLAYVSCGLWAEIGKSISNHASRDPWAASDTAFKAGVRPPAYPVNVLPSALEPLQAAGSTGHPAAPAMYRTRISTRSVWPITNGSISTTATVPSAVPASTIGTASPTDAASGEAVGTARVAVAAALVGGASVADAAPAPESPPSDPNEDAAAMSVCVAVGPAAACGRAGGRDRTSRTATATSRATEGPMRRQSAVRRVLDLLSWAAASLAGGRGRAVRP